MPDSDHSDTTGEQLTGSVLKALAILECFAGHRTPLSPAEIAKKVGVSRPTAYRLLATLANDDWVVQDPQNPSKYQLGHKILQVAGAHLEDLDVRQVAKPYMERLSRRFNETVKLWILDDTEVVYLGRVAGLAPIQTQLPLGSRGNLHSRAVGKAILAHLPKEEVARIAQTSGLPKKTDRTITTLDRLFKELDRVRKQGYAISDREDMEFLRAVAAPIFDFSGRPIGGLVVSTLAPHLTDDYIVTLGQALSEICLTISEQLGYKPRTGHSLPAKSSGFLRSTEEPDVSAVTDE